MQEYLEKTKQELKLRNYSFKTIKAYLERSKKLPIVLSREEIKNIIDVIKNPKHKLIISLA